MEPGPIKSASRSPGLGAFIQQPETGAVQPVEDGASPIGARKVTRKKIMRMVEERILGAWCIQMELFP